MTLEIQTLFSFIFLNLNIVPFKKEQLMPWRYSQSTGRLSCNGIPVAIGYSGAPTAKNNATYETVRFTGPIPRGRYRIGRPHDTTAHGPHVLALTPVGHNAHGRDGFLIHGDSRSAPGTASQGCIIIDINARHQISASGDNDLEVIP
jgi:hypothetical protein